MIYPGLYSGAIGSLLRRVQEEKTAQQPIPAATEASAPMREQVQEPLKGAESPGTSRIVSIRPEASDVAGAGSTQAPGIAARSSIGPVSIGGPGEPMNAQAPVRAAAGAPIRAVAANEPGAIPGIPSAGNTVGTTGVGDPNKENPTSTRAVAPTPIRATTPAPLPPIPGVGQDINLSGSQNALNRSDDSDRAYQEQLNKLEGPNAYNYLSPQAQQTVSQQVRDSIAKAKANQPAPTSKPQQQSQPQVLGSSTQQNNNNSITNALKKSPISWLATKLFGW